MYLQKWILFDYTFYRYTKIGFSGIFNNPLPAFEAFYFDIICKMYSLYFYVKIA